MDPISRQEVIPISNIPGTTTSKLKTSLGDVVSVVKSNGIGLPIVLIHDSGSSGKQFGHIVDGPIGRKYNVICPDLPGHGSTPPALFPDRVYSIAALGKVVVELIDQIKIRRAVFVGSGLGAQILMAAAAAIGSRSVGFVFSDIELAGEAGVPDKFDRRFPQSLLRPLSGTEFQSVASIIDGLPGQIAVIGGACPPDLAAALSPTSLWRSSVQIIPQSAGKGVMISQPNVFSMLLKAFVLDLITMPAAPETEEPLLSDGGDKKPQGIDWAKSQQALNPNFRGRAIPGTMPHPGSRFEAPTEPEPKPQTSDQFYGKQVSITNPNNRGRVIGGTMPHPQSRFELVEESRGDQQSPMPNANPNTRGRIIPGTMPHPLSRFDYVSPEEANATNPTSTPNSEVLQNPNRRGRIVGGTMPHPSSRFEDAQGGGVFDSPRVQASEVERNPNARGRIIGGTMPHPSSRFEISASQQTSQSRSSTRVTQAPGGNTSFVFG